MDEPTELLVATVKTWSNKYAHKIYVKEKDEEKKEHHFNVVFFRQLPNESIPKCTVNVHFVLTEILSLDFLNNEDNHVKDLSEKYFISFQFEHEKLTRTLDMNLNFEKWIDKLMEDKQKFRNKINLSSDYMKSRFVKPVGEEKIQQILQQIKDDREMKRNKENGLPKKSIISEKKKETVSLKDKTKERDTTEKEKLSRTPKEQLNEALSFLRNVLYEHFIDVDLKKKGKVKQEMFVEILKMVNYKICLSFLYAQESIKRTDEEKTTDVSNEQNISFFFDEQKSTVSSSSSSSIVSSNSSSSSSSGDNSAYSINISNRDMHRKEKDRNHKDEKKHISTLFNIKNKEVDLIKDINIYKNANFNGCNIFWKDEDVASILLHRNCNHFIFDPNNSYYQYLYTDNPYDFLLYTAYLHEDDSGWVQYKNYVHLLTTYLYKIKKNRELYKMSSLDDLIAYKQYMYICYENELNFMTATLNKHFTKYDPNDSGFIHRNKLKKVFQENDHIISKQEYKLLLRALNSNDDNYIYYKNLREMVLRLRFEGIKNSIFEKDETLLHKYLCEELAKHKFQNRKKLHIFDCKNILDSCDDIYLNKNTIHVILSSLNFDENLEVDTNFFLQICVTMLVNMLKLEKMQMIYNVLMKDKEKKNKSQGGDSTIVYKKKRDSAQIEKVNVPALELVEKTLTKLFKVLDEKNEDMLEIDDFIRILLESSKKKKVIDIKEICKFSTNELQGFVAEINTQSFSPFYDKNVKLRGNPAYNKTKKIHYPSHIHKWCSKTYQIGSCYYYSYFLNYPELLVQLDNNITRSICFSEVKKG